nr:helveticin J family class III bacteriocin [Lactobacillus hamsteri]
MVKISGRSTDSANWEEVSLTNVSSLNESGYSTELEGIQLISDNDLILNSYIS